MEMGNNQMREKPCLTDYKMKTRERALLETVMEMVDSFQIIRNGLKDSNWSEIECIPANGAQHFMIHQLREDYWVGLIDMAIIYRRKSDLVLVKLRGKGIRPKARF